MSLNKSVQVHGGDHDGSKHTGTVPAIDHSERLCTLLDDARILGIASAILGDDFNYAGGDANFYVGNTGLAPGRKLSRSVCHQAGILPRPSDPRYRLPARTSRQPPSRLRMANRRIATPRFRSVMECASIRDSRQCCAGNQRGRSRSLQPQHLPRLVWRCHSQTYVHHEFAQARQNRS